MSRDTEAGGGPSGWGLGWGSCGLLRGNGKLTPGRRSCLQHPLDTCERFMPLPSIKPLAEHSLCTKHGANHTTTFLEVRIIISCNGCHWCLPQIPFTAAHPFSGCPEKWLINHLLPHPWGWRKGGFPRPLGTASPPTPQLMPDWPGLGDKRSIPLSQGRTHVVIYPSGFPCLAFSCTVLLHPFSFSVENILPVHCLTRRLQLKFYS